MPDDGDRMYWQGRPIEELSRDELIEVIHHLASRCETANEVGQGALGLVAEVLAFHQSRRRCRACPF